MYVSHKKDNLEFELWFDGNHWITRATGLDNRTKESRVLLSFDWEDKETATKEYRLMLQVFGVRSEHKQNTSVMHQYPATKTTTFSTHQQSKHLPIANRQQSQAV